jgi:hypothetical protein
MNDGFSFREDIASKSSSGTPAELSRDPFLSDLV